MLANMINSFFDEIFVNNVSVLTRIHTYVKTTSNKIVIATGDAGQLKPVETVTDQFDYRYYLILCVDQIFPNQVFLEEIQRINDPEQQQLAKCIVLMES